MADVYYRVHWKDCPPLSPENAWSALWGTQRTPDGTQTYCVTCDGTGEGARTCPTCRGLGRDEWDWDAICTRCGGSGVLDGCESCDGEGVWDCLYGYSCFADPQSLVDYFAARHGTVEDDDTVVIFEGEYYGTGFDGEDLAVPTRIIEEITWSEFLTRMS